MYTIHRSSLSALIITEEFPALHHSAPCTQPDCRAWGGRLPALSPRGKLQDVKPGLRRERWVNLAGFVFSFQVLVGKQAPSPPPAGEDGVGLRHFGAEQGLEEEVRGKE